MENMGFLAPVLSVLALIFAMYLAGKINKASDGNDRMREIAGAISEGARAFLMAEYRILVVFVAVLLSVTG